MNKLTNPFSLSLAGVIAVVPAVNAEQSNSSKINEQQSGTLEVVQVIATEDILYKPEPTSSATKTSMDLKDVPQSVSVVTKELMNDQKNYFITDVLRNVSGISQESSSGDLTIRGFGFGRNRIITINGLRMKKGWMPDLISNLERIEVIKGANSALYGFSNPGGTLNRVTKKPLDEQGGSFNVSLGSFNTKRSSIDITGPVTNDGTILYRFNGAYQDSDTFRDINERKDTLIAPSISFLPSDKTRIDLDFIYTHFDSRIDRGQPFLNIENVNKRLNSTPISLNATKKNSFSKEDSYTFLTAISHEINDKLKFNFASLYNHYEFNRLEHRTNNGYAALADGSTNPNLLNARLIHQYSKETSLNFNSYLTFKMNTGDIEHIILAGYDYDQQDTPPGSWIGGTRGGYRNAANDGTIKKYKPSNINDYLLDSNGNPVPNMPHFDLLNPNYDAEDINNYILPPRKDRATTKFFSHGIYIQDQIKIGKLQVLAGIRQEYHTDFIDYDTDDEIKVTAESLIPRIGAVYTLNDNINFFGTYLEGFQPQSNSRIKNFEDAGGPFKPLVSNLIEFGAKTAWFNRRFIANASIYQIEQNNILISAEDSTNEDLLIQRGQEVSKGFEIELYGQILPNLSLSANYSYNEARITKSDDPEEVGRIKQYAPQHMSGSWLKYDINDGTFAGLSAAFGTTYVSKQTAKGRTYDNFYLPSYTVYDAAFYYQINEDLQVSANINNLTDKKYWVGRGRASSGITANPGAPRNFLLSIGYEF